MSLSFLFYYAFHTRLLARSEQSHHITSLIFFFLYQIVYCLALFLFIFITNFDDWKKIKNYCVYKIKYMKITKTFVLVIHSLSTWNWTSSLTETLLLLFETFTVTRNSSSRPQESFTIRLQTEIINEKCALWITLFCSSRSSTQCILHPF